LSEASAEVKEEHRRQVQYFRNHEHKMDYPRYLANGWQIGSGPVESACKSVVGNRLTERRASSEPGRVSASPAISNFRPAPRAHCYCEHQ